MNLSVSDIIKDTFQQNPLLNRLHLENLIVSRIFDKNTNFKRSAVNKEAFWGDIKGYLKNNASNKIEKLILENILLTWTQPDTYIQRRENEINQLLSKNWRVKEKIVATDHKEANYYPIYILKNSKLNK